MKTVSYTRATSCNQKNDVPVYSISQQNEHIEKYAREHGVIIEKKYVDRKNDPVDFASFDKMRIDGQNRNYDMIITDSVWQCGKDIFQMVRLLKESLYPAGIEFAVVSEDFSSEDHTKEEVNRFLDDLWNMYLSHTAEARMAKRSNIIHLETYGYRYDWDKDCLLIEEKSAAIVKEIFEKLLEGMTPGQVAQELTERGIENPGDYRCRMRGWKLRGNNRGWDVSKVTHIAKEQKFTGRRKLMSEGRDYSKDCPPIIDPEKYDEVQILFDQRRHHKLDCVMVANPFQRMMTDEETGAVVIVRKHGKTRIPEYRFKPKKPEGIRYEKISMDYHEAIEQMRVALMKEHERAVIASEYVNSLQAREDADNRIEDARKCLPLIMSRLHENECKRIELVSRYLAGSVSAEMYDSELIAINDRYQKLNSEIVGVYTEITDIETTYSDNNPWIKLFAQYDESQELTGECVRKYCEHVNIWRFEEIRPVLKETKWRDRLLQDQEVD